MNVLQYTIRARDLRTHRLLPMIYPEAWGFVAPGLKKKKNPNLYSKV